MSYIDSRSVGILRLVVFVGLTSLFLVLVGCSDCGDPDLAGTDTGPTGDILADAPDLGGEDVVQPPIICEPGELIGCREENTPAIDVCNEAGTEIVASTCGETEVCRQDVCVEVICQPGTRRCDGISQPQVCDEDGEKYDNLDPCGEGLTCGEGYCLNRCAVAERSNSYIGCEYWAVELENHLLNDSEPPLPENRRPPFAIVLANTSSEYEAEISVYGMDGEIASSVGSRVVGTDISFPGDEWVTVHSEVLGPNGQRVQGPLNGPIENIIVPRESVVTLLMPHRRIPFGSSSLTDGAFKVVSSQPVVAYQFNPFCCNYNYTNDASLLLPTSALTENYMFMSYAVYAGNSTRRLENPFSATLTVVATQEDTEVSVQLRPSVSNPDRPFNQLIYPITNSQRVSGPDAEGIIQVTMQPFEVLNIAGRGAAPVEDLTGARITASKPVATFGGHTCTNVPFTFGACDHVESQLFPLETWGQRFVAAPLKMRGTAPENAREGTYWKFLARSDDTRITTGINLRVPNVLGPAGEGVKHCSAFSEVTNTHCSNDTTCKDAHGALFTCECSIGAQTCSNATKRCAETSAFTLSAGQSCEFGTKQMFVADATAPVMLGAFLSGQGTVSSSVDWDERAGDPTFFLVPPQEQYRNTYSFLAPPTYFKNFATVTIAPGFKVMLDGQEVDLLDHDHEILPGGSVVRAHIPISRGPHRIRASIPFGLVVYGYDNYVSYAYTGGMDLTKLNPL